jgi:anthranilate synthase/aminodeoxychorismate synthase-like glutamine amidotransferase
MTRATRILVVDNYDSFVFTIVGYLQQLGADCEVVRNDAVSVAAIEELAPARIVISPGPGRPETAGVSIAALRHFAGRVPLLGVCLGHQALSIAFGGRVERATAPMHGKTSMVAHWNTHVFAGLGTAFEAGRYHSLIIPRDALPKDFVLSAWVEEDGTVMGIRHERWPVFGVQFHPESVLTPSGQRVLQNFLEAR